MTKQYTMKEKPKEPLWMIKTALILLLLLIVVMFWVWIKF